MRTIQIAKCSVIGGPSDYERQGFMLGSCLLFSPENVLCPSPSAAGAISGTLSKCLVLKIKKVRRLEVVMKIFYISQTNLFRN